MNIKRRDEIASISRELEGLIHNRLSFGGSGYDFDELAFLNRNLAFSMLMQAYDQRGEEFAKLLQDGFVTLLDRTVEGGIAQKKSEALRKRHDLLGWIARIF